MAKRASAPSPRRRQRKEKKKEDAKGTRREKAENRTTRLLRSTWQAAGEEGKGEESRESFVPVLLPRRDCEKKSDIQKKKEEECVRSFLLGETRRKK